MTARKYKHEDGTGLKRQARTWAAMTPEELADWIAANLYGAAYEPLISSGVNMEWYSPRTLEEAEAERVAEERAKERTEKWERETYARLHEKYGTVEAPKEGFNW